MYTLNWSDENGTFSLCCGDDLSIREAYLAIRKMLRGLNIKKENPLVINSKYLPWISIYLNGTPLDPNNHWEPKEGDPLIYVTD
ncbi:hypothetical protein KAR91_47150 [Candidatus Pacearchaeota archaeon]|nr:hypothetical protein [Candidatus Pacearchaeota archaeon]